jgi:hypothetical protein
MSLCYAISKTNELFHENYLIEKEALLKQVIIKSGWKARSKGINLLNDFQDNELKEKLLYIIKSIVNTNDYKNIVFSDILEQMSYLSLLDNTGELNKEILHYHLNDIEEEDFYNKTEDDAPENIIFVFRTLFFLLVKYNCNAELKQRMLNMGNSDGFVEDIQKTRMVNIFLFLWNLYALWVDVSDNGVFKDFINKEILKTVLSKIKNININKLNYNNGLDDFLKLIGFLYYINITETGKLKLKLWPGVIEDKKVDFISAFFYLNGLEINTISLSYDTWKAIDFLTEGYTTQTKALKELITIYKERITYVDKKNRSKQL